MDSVWRKQDVLDVHAGPRTKKCERRAQIFHQRRRINQTQVHLVDIKHIVVRSIWKTQKQTQSRIPWSIHIDATFADAHQRWYPNQQLIWKKLISARARWVQNPIFKSKQNIQKIWTKIYNLDSFITIIFNFSIN